MLLTAREDNTFALPEPKIDRSHRWLGLGLMLAGASFIARLGTFGFVPDLLVGASTVFFFVSWMKLAGLLGKIPPEMQVQVGFASREDFKVGANGELLNLPE